MKEKIRLLVVDDNKNYVDMIKEFFSNNDKIRVVHECYDGNEAFDYINNNGNEFDVLLLDLIMPKKDGIYVLESMQKEGIKKPTIVCTSFNADETISKIARYNPKDFVVKPIDLLELEKKVIASTKETEPVKGNNENDLEISVSRLLHDLGVPSHIKGYQYIREGVLLMYESPEIVGAITKELYPEIATRYDTTVSRVERAIRHAIEVSWNRGDVDLMEEIFGHSVDYDRAKPTNSEFIVTLSDKLRLEHNAKKSHV